MLRGKAAAGKGCQETPFQVMGHSHWEAGAILFT